MRFFKSKNKKNLSLILVCIFLCITTTLFVFLPIDVQKTQDTENQISTAGSGYIEVTVFDVDTGVPLNYSTVKISNSTWSDTYSTGSDNLVILPGLTVGWYWVNVSYIGYKEMKKQDYINWEGDDDYLTFNLEAWGPGTGYIEIRVMDETTEALLQGANVQVKFDNGTYYTGGTTDSNGFYNATDLYIGWYDITVSRYNYHTQSKFNYINWNGDDDYLNFSMSLMPPDSGYVEIYVRDNESIPIQSAFVTVQNGSDASNPTIISGYTNAAGFFNASGLTIGWYTINVSKVGYQGPVSKADYINWFGDDDYIYFTLTPHNPGTGYIEVTVYNNSGNPISGAYVKVINFDSGETVAYGYTDGSGFFNASGLDIGWYYVNVFKSGYVTEVKQNYINWNGDDDYLYYYLDEVDNEKLKVNVHVKRESANWLSVENAYVKFTQSGSLVCESNTLSNGYATGYNIVNTSLLGIEVKKPGYTTYINSSIDLTGYDEGDTVDIYVYMVGGESGTGYIEVRVRDATNTSIKIANADVNVRFPNGTWFNWGQTDVDGFINITDLYEYSWYTINISKPGSGYIGPVSKDNYINWPADDDYLTFDLNKISFSTQTLTLDTITPNPDPVGDIDLHWNSLYWVTSFKIYRGPNPSSLELIATVGPSTLTYLDIGVTPGTTVYYQIIATNGSTNLLSNIESVEIYAPEQAIPGFELYFIVAAVILLLVIKQRKKIGVKSFFKKFRK